VGGGGEVGEHNGVGNVGSKDGRGGEQRREAREQGGNSAAEAGGGSGLTMVEGACNGRALGSVRGCGQAARCLPATMPGSRSRRGRPRRRVRIKAPAARVAQAPRPPSRGSPGAPKRRLDATGQGRVRALIGLRPTPPCVRTRRPWFLRWGSPRDAAAVAAMRISSPLRRECSAQLGGASTPIPRPAGSGT